MKNEIEPFDVTTGWSGSDASVTIHGLNQVPDYIAGLNSASLVIKFDGSLNQYAQKTVSFDLTDYDELVFHIWSRNKQMQGWNYWEEGDFVYKIEFGTSDVFYVPTFNMFSDITLDISNITTIDKIKITCLHNNEDYIILSHMVAVKDEIPRDIFQGTKEMLENDLLTVYSKFSGGSSDGILVGTISNITAGDSTILINGLNRTLDKYAIIKIKDGSNSEIHQIGKCDEVEAYFTDYYAGETMQNSYSTASIYLQIPIEYGLSEKDIILPGIALWGLTPEPVYRNSKEEYVYDTYKTDGSLKRRLDDQINQYDILIDCEARTNEILNFMKFLVMKMIGREFIWVNGKKISVDFVGVPTWIEPVQSYNQIPKIQYIMKVEVKEEIYSRESLPATSTVTTGFNLSSELLS